jgi:hypothetical protein
MRSSQQAALSGIAILVFGLVLVSGVNSQLCNREYLNYFQDSIKLHLKPSREANLLACNDEFSKYNTCCETESLQDFMEKGVEADALRWNNALKNMHIFRKEVIEKRDILVAKIADLLKSLEQAVREGRVRQVGLDAAKMLNKYLPMINKTYHNKTEKNYRAEAQACFDEVSTLRKNSLCLVCSGRSSIFFNGQRMTIKQRTCESLIESCFNTFSFMFSVMGTSRALLDLVNAIERKVIFKEGRDAIPYNSRLV